MIDQYAVLKLERGAKQDEVQRAFDELLAARRAKRQRTGGDLHAAVAILGDPTLRKAHDLALLGEATSDKLVLVKDRAVEVAGQVKERIPEVDARELAVEAWHLTLRTTVLATGVSAKVADALGDVSRRAQLAAARALERSDQ